MDKTVLKEIYMMKSIVNKIRLKKSIVSKVFICLFIAVFISTYLTTALNKHQPIIPDNPLNEAAENYSEVFLSGGYMDLVHAEDERTEEENEEESKKNNDDSEQKEETQKELEQKTKSQDSNKNDHNMHNEEKGQDNNGGPSSASDPNSSNLEIVSPEDDDEDALEPNEYFVTTIQDNEVTGEKEYTFQIKQLKHDYLVRNVDVSLDSEAGEVMELSEDYSKPVVAKVNLSTGENKISVAVTYEDDIGTTFTVLRNYLVIYDEKSIVIETDLQDQEVYEETLAFKATATIEDKKIPVQVIVKQGNDETKLEEQEDNQYVATLHEGKNNITIQAEANGRQAVKEFTIDYYKPDLKIETDLTKYNDKTVKNQSFDFMAKAFDGEEEIDISVAHNETSLQSDDGKYNVSLKEGKNTFYLEAVKGAMSHSETYSVFYEPEAVGGEEDNDEDNHAPTITVSDITDGETINNSIRTFHVKVKNYRGESITGSGKIHVTNNGEDVPRDHTDSQQISFKLQIKEGTNHIVIHAEDAEGNTATKELTITGKVGEDGSPAGTITISMEATTIGLGYLISPQQMEIYQGERATYVIDRLLKDHGFQFSITGKNDDRFYLEAVSKPGLVTNPKIPDDLLNTLEKHNVITDPNSYDANWLGEMDFNNLSGWMYSVNGVYANVGFADYYFKDGDVVRIRYTLALGNDIGGGLDNFHKEW